MSNVIKVIYINIDKHTYIHTFKYMFVNDE